MERVPTRTIELTHFCPVCGLRGPTGGSCERDRTPLRAIPAHGILGKPLGNFVPVALIGEGGMGAVYRAVHPAIGSRVAIKILNIAGGAAAQRFLREAQAANRIHHPGVVKVLDAGALADGRPYLVMEWLDGASVAELAQRGPLPVEIACSIVCDAAAALDALHAEGIVHRDLKPHNLFVEKSGRVVVLDLGIAKLLDVDARLTQTGAIVGTPSYMAPEQIDGRPIDARTDIYALGIVLYELLSGRRAFDAALTVDILRQQLAAQPALHATVPALDPVIARAMAKEPAQRFATAGQLRAAIAAQVRPAQPGALASLVTGDRAAIAEAPTVAGHRVLPRRPRPIALALALVAAAAVGSGVVLLIARGRGAAAPLDAAVAIEPADAPHAIATDAPLVAVVPGDAPLVVTPPTDAPLVAVAPRHPAPLDAGHAHRDADTAVDHARTNEDGATVECHGRGIAETCSDPDDSEWRTNSAGVRVRCKDRACYAGFNLRSVPAVPAASDTLPATTHLAGHGEAAFRADRWLLDAERIARGIAPDAVLTRLTTRIAAGGVSANGQAIFELRSPSHPGIALRVIAARDAVDVIAFPDHDPRPYVYPPRCTLDKLWHRVTSAWWPSATTVFVDYNAGAWDAGEPGDRHVLADYCP